MHAGENVKRVTEVFELHPTEDTENELWRHGLYVEDAFDVLDENRYKVFRDPGHPDRLKLIGPGRSGRILTFVVTRPDGQGRSFVITGWPSDSDELTMHARPGGTRHA